MPTFIGREPELAMLEDAFASGASSMIPIYGRRRVGKTELILEFTRAKRCLYHLGEQSVAGVQQASFMESLGECLEQPTLGQTTVTNWKQALQLLNEQWPTNEPLLLVLDEFQWMVEASPELPSLLQGLWDRTWKKRGNVMLILCGSYIGFMEREVLGRKSPLFGRRTAQIKLEPFSFRESADFHPKWTIEEKAKAWFLCGGIPYYLECFDANASIPKNIRNAFLKPFSPLYRESEYLLREELRELENYHSILLALSKANQPAKQLAQQTGISERSLFYYLTQLEELHYIAKKYPLVPGKTPRRVLYSLHDPLLRFWFRFIHSRRGLLARLGPRAFYDKKIAPELDAYFGHCFERLCREYLPSWYVREEIYEGFELGEYWDKSVHIDLVGLREDHVIDLGECKWGRVTSLNPIAKELDRKAAAYPTPGDWRVATHVFLRKSPRKQPAGIQCHTLDEMYQI